MIRTISGNTRFVIVLFNLLVIKLPLLRTDLINKPITRPILFAMDCLDVLYMSMLFGCIANLSEALNYYWCQGKPKMLAKVVTLGFCNFQLYYGEDTPDEEEIMSLLDNLDEKTSAVLREVDAHAIAAYNWRRTSDGLKIIDYASDPLKDPWSILIRMSWFKIEDRNKTP